jgi:hypothetical protein
MVEMAKADAIIVTGGDNGFNRIIVQPEINSLADLRGKTVAVDAPNTAYALLLYKALKVAGLNKGDYSINAVGGTTERLSAMKTDKAHAAAAVMNVPFNFQATAAGLKELGSATADVGAYQAGAVVVMRDWAKANSAPNCWSKPAFGCTKRALQIASSNKPMPMMWRNRFFIRSILSFSRMPFMASRNRPVCAVLLLLFLHMVDASLL